MHEHLSEAAGWLVRAQGHGSDRGVCLGADFGKGFMPYSYPETTGYIICFFLELAKHYGDEKWQERAVLMADWEEAIRMSCGGVMGGMYNRNPRPAVFNTGTVLLAVRARSGRIGWQVDVGNAGAGWKLGAWNRGLPRTRQGRLQRHGCVGPGGDGRGGGPARVCRGRFTQRRFRTLAAGIERLVQRLLPGGRRESTAAHTRIHAAGTNRNRQPHRPIPWSS